MNAWKVTSKQRRRLHLKQCHIEWKCKNRPCIERHRRVIGILSEVQVSGSSQLLLDHQRLLEQLETSGEEFVLHLQEVSFALICFKRFIDNHERDVILHVLPPAITVLDDSRQQPVVMAAMPNLSLITCQMPKINKTDKHSAGNLHSKHVSE